MAESVIFVTGTDTGVGKTVVATAMVKALRERGTRVGVSKPLCSGGREDARRLRQAAGSLQSLDEINPWHFRAPLAPLVAAHRERRTLLLEEVLGSIRKLFRRYEFVVIEGAGGLLSPLGEDFDCRDLMGALAAQPVIVAANRLGAVNQVRLTVEALPRKLRGRAVIVLVNPPRPGIPSKSNPELLEPYVTPASIHLIPWLRVPSAPNFQFNEAIATLLQSVVG